MTLSFWCLNQGLDLRDYIHPDCQPANPETKYDLVANVCHDGKPEKGSYKAHMFVSLRPH